MNKIVITILASTLAACGGGSSDSTSTPETPITPEAPVTSEAPETPVVVEEIMPIGLWEGEVVSDDVTYQTIGLIAPDGETRFITDDGEQNKVTIVLSGNDFTGEMTGYDNTGILIGSGTITGTYSSTSMSGSTTVNNELISSFNLDISENSNNSADFDTIKGNYSTLDGETSLAIDEDGLLSGSSTNGCQYSGNATIPDSTVNVYKLVLEVSSCGIFNSTYTGLASYTTLFNISPQTGFLFQVDNGVYSLTNFIVK